MGLMSSKMESEKLRPGDHIYTWRSGYSYSHHGIYVGDGKVIHLTRGPGLIIFSSTSRAQPWNDRVVCCNIQDFLCDGQLYRFEYDASPVVFLIKRAGTCSLASSNPPEDVLHRAYFLLHHGFGDYHLLNKNCETFAIYCKTGYLEADQSQGGRSGQITSLVAAIMAVIIIPYRFLPASLIALPLVVCGLYCLLRLSLDVGPHRSGGAVVAVEKLDHLSNTHNVRENIMAKTTTTRWSLLVGEYFSYTVWAIRYWYWTPQSTRLPEIAWL
ncbi:hypothetical protein FNV43_RR15385 [Rhamnella rubrinervis]|uniref:LRAT domain-containing protein n=1 Tax=Rhamnella rubrinervis TaxID=2594499 RepID=A0A8K0E3A9_9ROSA|nr:hypothetical protein FNV43_RR15385 [Rhamnella rubrinervis]